ncbi:MAG: hypothetical protein JXR58_08665 [Bacteroidales bacterium]|nr:hypothetical protein [Bacteroidales bacterium]
MVKRWKFRYRSRNICRSYTVTVTDLNGCTATNTVSVNDGGAPTVTIDATTNVSCNGVCDGTASASAVGGTAPYNFAWSSGGNTDSETGICAGIHYVTLTDANSCSSIDSFVITQPEALTLNLQTVNETCFEYCNGSVSAVVTGGIEPYSALWNNSNISLNITNLCSNTYCVTITDLNGCELTDCSTLQPPSELTMDYSIIDANCNSSNGEIYVIANGGTPEYTYEWAPPIVEETNVITNIYSGFYTVTITDHNNCTISETISISDIEGPLVDSIIVQNVSCFNYNDGSAEVFFSQGNPAPPYSIEWNDINSQQTNLAIDLVAGNYIVTVTDFNGCNTSAMVTINQFEELIGFISFNNDVLCFGDSNGIAEVAATGGNMPYSFVWDNNETTEIVTNLTVGIHTVTITDANSCETTTTVEINQPDIIAINGTTTDASCFGYSDGSVSLSVSGGIEPYNYIWSTSSNISHIESDLGIDDVITVTVTDVNGCMSISSFSVNQPDSISVVLISTPETCNESNGSAEIVAVSGGTPVYSYSWSPGASSDSIYSNISNGEYFVTVSDSRNCQTIASIIVEALPVPENISFQTSPILCNNDSNGEITANVIGGVPDFSFYWSNSSNQQTISGLVAGEYSVTATDINGCTVSNSITLSNPSPIQISASGPNLACFNQLTMLNAVVSGGTEPYLFYWNGIITDSATHLVQTVSDTSFLVYVVDNNGCGSNVVNISINIYPELNLSVFANDSVICSGESVNIYSDYSGGFGSSYNLYLNGNIVTPPIILSPNQTTQYNFVLEDNCSNPVSDSLIINVAPAPKVDFNASIYKGCEPLTVEFNTNNPCDNCVFEWSFGNGEYDNNSSPDSVTYIHPGSYDVSLSLTNEFGCSSNQTISNMISVFPNPHASFYAYPSSTSILYPYIEFYNNWSNGQK